MPDVSLEEFLASYPPPVRDLALKTRALILSVIPNAVELVDPPSKIVAYGLGSKYADLVCAIAPYQAYLNLIFSTGAQLPDPDRLLSGTGKKARHVKITQPEGIDAPGVRRLIEEALQKTRLANKL